MAQNIDDGCTSNFFNPCNHAPRIPDPPVADPLDPLTVIITLGNNKVNIGDHLRGPPLYDEIYKALVKACFGNMQECSGSSVSFTVHYNDTDYQQQDTPLNLRSTLKWKDITNDQLLLLIGTVAQTIEVMSDDEKNCYQYEKMKTKYCNINDYVSVEDNRGNLFEVKFNTDRGPAGGHFDCVAVQIATNDRFTRQQEGWRNLFGAKSLMVGAVCINIQVSRRTIEDVFLEHDIDASQSTKIMTHDPDIDHLAPRIPDPPVADPLKITITLGHVKGYTKATVGNLSEGALYHNVYQTLLKACPENEQSCSDKETFKVHYSEKDETDLHVDPELKPKTTLSNDARLLFIDTVAQTIEVMANNEKNSYNYKGQKNYNIISRVTVTDNRGNSLEVDFHTDSEMDQGNFDCEAVKSDTRDRLNLLKDEYAEALGGNKDEDWKTWEVECKGHLRG
jgi:hypothetical protein